jgi:hypothetical protein
LGQHKDRITIELNFSSKSSLELNWHFLLVNFAQSAGRWSGKKKNAFVLTFHNLIAETERGMLKYWNAFIYKNKMLRFHTIKNMNLFYRIVRI